MKRPLILILGSSLGWWALPGTGAEAPEASREVSVGAQVDRSLIALGEEVLYTLTVNWARGQVRDPQLRPLGLEGFQVTGPDLQRSSGPQRITQTFTYHLRPLHSGVLTIGPAMIDYQTARSNEPRTITGQSLTLTVVDLTGREGIRDIKELLPVPVSYRQVGWMVGGAVTAGVLLMAAFLLHRRRASRSLPPPAIPLESSPPSAQERVQRELAALYAAHLPEQGRVDEFHVRLSEIVRRYLGDRYSFPALESTTSEIRRQLQQGTLPEHLIQEVDDILQHCDREKFGAYQPSRAEMDELFAAAERFVNRTPN